MGFDFRAAGFLSRNTGQRCTSPGTEYCLDEIGRQAILTGRAGANIEAGTSPRKGLAVARMTAHIIYLSEAALHRKFGHNLQERSGVTFGFDANSYLYLTRAMNYFDLAAEYGGHLSNAFCATRTRFFIASFSSDRLFPTRESQVIVHALNAAGASVSFAEVRTDRGHDAFLLYEPVMFSTMNGFLQSAARARGLGV